MCRLPAASWKGAHKIYGQHGQTQEQSRLYRFRQALDKVMNGVFFFCGAVSIAAVVLITAYLVIAGLPAIREIGIADFLFGTEWASTAAEPKFGILPFILTSVWGMLGAIAAWACPWG